VSTASDTPANSEAMSSRKEVASPGQSSPSEAKRTNVSITTSEFNTTHDSSYDTSPQRKLLRNQEPKSTAAVDAQLKIDRDARALNISLEQSLMVTLRREAAVGSILFIDLGQTEKNSLLNASNIDNVICNRLMDQSEVLNAVTYLIQCYKRVQIKETSASTASMREELVRCRSTLISYLSTCLGSPETFDVNSERSVSDLVTLLQEDSNVVLVGLLKELLEELDKVDFLSDVLNQIFDACFDKLNGSAQLPPSPSSSSPNAALAMFRNQTNAPPKIRSVLDNYAPALTVITNLVRADHKRVCRVLVQFKHFQFTESMNRPAPNDPMNNPVFSRMMMQSPTYIETAGQKGCALEHKTLLGRILRISPDVRDPQLVEYFRDAVSRPTRSAVEGKVAEIRKICTQAQSVCAEVLLGCLRAGGVSKTEAMQWLQHAIVLNLEAEKERPSPLMGASNGFMINFGAVMLQVNSDCCLLLMAYDISL